MKLEMSPTVLDRALSASSIVLESTMLGLLCLGILLAVAMAVSEITDDGKADDWDK